MSLAATMLPEHPGAIAPDGSDVRILCALKGGGMAHFTLAAGRVSKAVKHRTVEEIWFILAGRGEMWRKTRGEEQVTALRPGLSLTIPLGAAFQFRAAEGGPLQAVAITMPPWPGADEAEAVQGLWPA